MTPNGQVAAALAAFAIVSFIWMARIDTQPLAGAPNGYYVLTNRLSGAVEFCAGRTCQPVTRP